jgi:hypothetical protein
LSAVDPGAPQTSIGRAADVRRDGGEVMTERGTKTRRMWIWLSAAVVAVVVVVVIVVLAASGGKSGSNNHGGGNGGGGGGGWAVGVPFVLR